MDPIIQKCSYQIPCKYIETVYKKISDIEDNNNTLHLKIIFHILFPLSSAEELNTMKHRIDDMIFTLNDDFNNYTELQNTMNNFKYKTIIKQLFSEKDKKRNYYLQEEIVSNIPTVPANIVFNLADIYYYPSGGGLNLPIGDNYYSQIFAIKLFIHNNGAYSILPENFINIWFMDLGNNILGFSSFPFENLDSYHGIVLDKRCLFPEYYREKNFNLFKSITHHLGHYLGLIHLEENPYRPQNLHEDVKNYQNPHVVIDPNDAKSIIQTDDTYVKSFSNFMDHTIDRYVSHFTKNQISQMRKIILTYYNGLLEEVTPPTGKYYPKFEEKKIESHHKKPENLHGEKNQGNSKKELYVENPIDHEEEKKMQIFQQLTGRKYELYNPEDVHEKSYYSQIIPKNTSVEIENYNFEPGERQYSCYDSKNHNSSTIYTQPSEYQIPYPEMQKLGDNVYPKQVKNMEENHLPSRSGKNTDERVSQNDNHQKHQERKVCYDPLKIQKKRFHRT